MRRELIPIPSLEHRLVVMLRLPLQLLLYLNPMLEHLAYAIIGWVAIKLTMMSVHNFSITEYGKTTGIHVEEMSHSLFWAVMGVMVVGGTLLSVRHAKKKEAESAELAEEER